jgi:thiol-disulfide isomerase/thioredoxin
MATIAHGDQVDLGSHLVESKYTLFDFYADWCPGCRQLEPYVKDLADEHPEQLAVRKIDIVRWGSPVASQYRLSSIPHLILFSPQGELLAQGDPGSVLDLLQSRLGTSLRQPSAAAGRSGLTFFFVAIALVVVAGLLFSSLRRPEPVPPLLQEAPVVNQPPATGDAGEAWFVIIQGSLEGPFSATQLDDMVQRSVLTPDTQVRRHGESSWHLVSDIISG